MKVATPAGRVNEAELRAKFFRMLEMDRDTPEFEHVFREVDEALGRLSGRCEAPEEEAV